MFACRAPRRLQNGPSAASMFSGVQEVRGHPILFLHTSSSPEVLSPQQNGFSVQYSVPRVDLVASTEHTLHRYDRVTLRKVGFDGKCCAARWTTPSLRLGRVVKGTSRLRASFEPNPTLLRLPLPSQCPTESREGILPHPVYIYIYIYIYMTLVA